VVPRQPYQASKSASVHITAVLAVRGLFRSRKETGHAGDVVGTAVNDPKRTYLALSVATAGVLKTAMWPLFRLPAVSYTKLRGRHEGTEARLHRFITAFA
jgi:hypothetical protein